MKIIKFTFFILIIALVGACTKAEGPGMNDYILTPTDFKLSAVKTSLVAKWEYEGKDHVGFLTQVSTDANFVNVIKTDTVESESREAVFENMGYFTELFVRVRALSSNIVIHSDFTKGSIKPESILKSPLKAEVTATSAVLRWNEPSAGTLTHVLLIDNIDKTERTIQLSATDISSKSLHVSGLVSAGDYTVVIFAGEERKGVLTFASLDLRMRIYITGSEVTYETLFDAVAAAKENDVINVGGATYDFSSSSKIDVTKSLTIKATDGSEIMPTIKMSSFDLISSATLKLDGIKFEINSSTSQVFVGTNLSGKVNLEIENCQFTGAKTGLIYVANTNTAADISIRVSNSMFYKIGFQGGDFIDFRGGKVGFLTFTNCTFYDLGRDFIRFDSTSKQENSSSEPITFSNCTFDKICNSTQGRLVFMRTTSNTLFNKCIFTNKVVSKANSLGGGATVSFTNNVVFGAFNTEWGAGGVVSSNVVTLDPQYKNASGLDFTVQNGDVKALGYGDFRWLK